MDFNLEDEINKNNKQKRNNIYAGIVVFLLYALILLYVAISYADLS